MLSDDVARHVALHRSLGFRFRVQAGLLQLYADLAGARGEATIRTTTALEWAGAAPSPAQRRNRLLTLRRFALAMRAEDPRHEVPPAGAFGRPVAERRPPRIYAPEEVARLLRAAAGLAPVGGLRPRLYVTLIAGADGSAVARHMVALSTYLGHAKVTDTQWYLHATPALMAQIAGAGEALFRGGVP